MKPVCHLFTSIYFYLLLFTRIYSLFKHVFVRSSGGCLCVRIAVFQRRNSTWTKAEDHLKWRTSWKPVEDFNNPYSPYSIIQGIEAFEDKNAEIFKFVYTTVMLRVTLSVAFRKWLRQWKFLIMLWLHLHGNLKKKTWSNRVQVRPLLYKWGCATFPKCSAYVFDNDTFVTTATNGEEGYFRDDNPFITCHEGLNCFTLSEYSWLHDDVPLSQMTESWRAIGRECKRGRGAELGVW